MWNALINATEFDHKILWFDSQWNYDECEGHCPITIPVVDLKASRPALS